MEGCSFLWLQARRTVFYGAFAPGFSCPETPFASAMRCSPTVSGRSLFALNVKSLAFIIESSGFYQGKTSIFSPSENQLEIPSSVVASCRSCWYSRSCQRFPSGLHVGGSDRRHRKVQWKCRGGRNQSARYCNQRQWRRRGDSSHPSHHNEQTRPVTREAGSAPMRARRR